MGVICYKCPESGEEVTTAIETGKDTLVKMRAMDLTIWVWCPHCMAGHQINPPRRAWTRNSRTARRWRSADPARRRLTAAVPPHSGVALACMDRGGILASARLRAACGGWSQLWRFVPASGAWAQDSATIRKGGREPPLAGRLPARMREPQQGAKARRPHAVAARRRARRCGLPALRFRPAANPSRAMPRRRWLAWSPGATLRSSDPGPQPDRHGRLAQHACPAEPAVPRSAAAGAARRFRSGPGGGICAEVSPARQALPRGRAGGPRGWPRALEAPILCGYGRRIVRPRCLRSGAASRWWRATCCRSAKAAHHLCQLRAPLVGGFYRDGP
jgi:hypothetical protein